MDSTIKEKTIKVISDGNIAEQGTHETLLCQMGIYHHLVELQTS